MGLENNEFTHADGVSLKEFLLHKFRDQEKALALAERLLEKRLDSMNAFREQINRLEGTLVTKEFLDIIIKGIKEDKRTNVSTWLSVVALAISVLSIIVKFWLT